MCHIRAKKKKTEQQKTRKFAQNKTIHLVEYEQAERTLIVHTLVSFFSLVSFVLFSFYFIHSCVAFRSIFFALFVDSFILIAPKIHSYMQN